MSILFVLPKVYPETLEKTGNNHYFNLKVASQFGRRNQELLQFDRLSKIHCNL